MIRKQERAAQEAAKLAERNGRAFRAVREERDEARAKIRALTRLNTELREQKAGLEISVENFQEEARLAKDMDGRVKAVEARARAAEQAQRETQRLLDAATDERDEAKRQRNREARLVREAVDRERLRIQERDAALEQTAIERGMKKAALEAFDGLVAERDDLLQRLEIVTADRDHFKQLSENMQEAPVPAPANERAMIRKIVKSLRKHYHPHAADHVEEEFLR